MAGSSVHKSNRLGFGWVGAWLLATALALPAAHAATTDTTPVHGKAKAATSARSAHITKSTKLAKGTKSAKPMRSVKNVSARKVAVRAEPASASFGHLYGLQMAGDALELKSSVALVVDQETNEVLFSKNPQAVLPIASITKLMTALVVTEAKLSLHDLLTVTQDDVDATAGNRSRLKLGTQLSRGEMLHLALMASENRAAHLLGRTYPGGLVPFIAAMNAKAQALGMTSTRYVEPTGLSSSNQSSAEDLARLVRVAYTHPIIRDLSTSLEASVPMGTRQVQFRNTNGLVRNPGRCARANGRRGFPRPSRPSAASRRG